MRFLFSQRFVRFGIAGCVATIIHLGVFSLLVTLYSVAPVVASVPAFLAAVLASYGFNYRWTYEAKGSHRLYLPKYAVVAVFGLSMNVLITYVMVNLLGYWYGVALALVVTLVPTASYFLNRNWSFKAAPTPPIVDSRL